MARSTSKSALKNGAVLGLLDSLNTSSSEPEEDESSDSSSDDDEEPVTQQDSQADSWKRGGAPITPPSTATKKRKGMSLNCLAGCWPDGNFAMAVTLQVGAEIVKKVTYLVAITSALEMKKPASKCVVKNASIWLDSDEPWDTIKAHHRGAEGDEL
jgi:hypothetical protein